MKPSAQKFICFFTFVMGGMTLGMPLASLAMEEWTSADTLTVFTGLMVICSGVILGLRLPSKQEAVWEERAKRWEELQNVAARQRGEFEALYDKAAKQRDEALTGWERANENLHSLQESVKQSLKL